MSKFDDLPPMVKGTVLAMPWLSNGTWRLFPEEVRKAAAQNAVVQAVIDYYGGPERWVAMCDGGAMDPRYWPLGLPAPAPPVVVDPPRVLPATSGDFTPTAGVPFWANEIKQLLNEILRMVSR